jgi:Kef-type K+ transport system membrane component KefB
MSFATLALVSLVALIGPVLAMPSRLHLPAVLGEMLVGVILGRTGTATLHPGDATFSFFASIGFALVMFVAGSHVPIRNPVLLRNIVPGIGRVLAIAALAIGIAVVLSAAFHTKHAALYAVLMASSSAALILPMVDSLALGGDAMLAALPQIAIADVLCIVALPLVIDTKHVGRAALGALAVIGCSLVIYFVLRHFELDGTRRRLHQLSEKRGFALELRIELVLLFALAALAVKTHVSVMLAGFALGLVTSAIGEPRRLARQLFALTEGFFGPLFFVWLGASIDLRVIGHHPSSLALGVLLGAGAVVAHLVCTLPRFGLSPQISMLTSAQLGVPIAAVTLGNDLGLLHAGEDGAILLGAVITIVVATVGAVIAANRMPASAHSSPSRS